MRVISKIEFAVGLKWESKNDGSDNEGVTEDDIPIITHTITVPADAAAGEEEEHDDFDRLELMIFDPKQSVLLPLTEWECSDGSSCFTMDRNNQMILGTQEGIIKRCSIHEDGQFFVDENAVNIKCSLTNHSLLKVWELTDGSIASVAIDSQYLDIDGQLYDLKFSDISDVGINREDKDLFYVASESGYIKVYKQANMIAETTIQNLNCSCFANDNPNHIVGSYKESNKLFLHDFTKGEIVTEVDTDMTTFENLEQVYYTNFRSVYFGVTNDNHLLVFHLTESQGFTLIIDRKVGGKDSTVPLVAMNSYDKYIFIGSNQVIVYDLENECSAYELLR